MNLKDFYSEVNGDFDDVLTRLLKEERIEKFLLRILEKTDMDDLDLAIKNQDWEKAFVIAHTLKGMSLNLGLTSFTSKISDVTEMLRDKSVSDVDSLNNLYQSSKTEYKHICETITKYNQ